MARLAAALLFSFALLSGCGGETSGTPEAPGGDSSADAGSTEPAVTEPVVAEPADGDALVARGERVYRQVCIQCHAPDPTQNAVGPALAGSSLELLEPKVLRNEYPPGYTPKATTGVMIPLPHVEKDLPALAAYLASVEG